MSTMIEEMINKTITEQSRGNKIQQQQKDILHQILLEYEKPDEYQDPIQIVPDPYMIPDGFTYKLKQPSMVEIAKHVKDDFYYERIRTSHADMEDIVTFYWICQLVHYIEMVDIVLHIHVDGRYRQLCDKVKGEIGWKKKYLED